MKLHERYIKCIFRSIENSCLVYWTPLENFIYTFIANTIFIEAEDWMAAILLKMASAKDVYRNFIEKLFQFPNTSNNQPPRIVTHKECVILKVSNKDTRTMSPMPLTSLTTLWCIINFEYISLILLWCFHCWLWANKYWIGSFQNVIFTSRNENNEWYFELIKLGIYLLNRIKNIRLNYAIFVYDTIKVNLNCFVRHEITAFSNIMEIVSKEFECTNVVQFNDRNGKSLN